MLTRGIRVGELSDSPSASQMAGFPFHPIQLLACPSPPFLYFCVAGFGLDRVRISRTSPRAGCGGLHARRASFDADDML